MTKARGSMKSKGHGGELQRIGHAPTEFSRLVDVADIAAKGLDVSIRAEAAECAALARRAGIVAVESLTADFNLRKVEGVAVEVEVEGVLHARVVQTCVVSLEPFESVIDDPIEVDFAAFPAVVEAAPRVPDDRGAAADLRGVELETPDPIIDGCIDLGALAAEFLMLALEPYPRKPGVAFDATRFSSSGTEIPSPFAALQKLARRSDEED